MTDDSGVKGFVCDDSFMGDSVAGHAMNERCLLVLVHKFHGDRWLAAKVVPRKGPEEYHGEEMITGPGFFISTFNFGKNNQDPAKDPRIPGKWP